MNAPEKLRICIAPGVYILRAAPARARLASRRAAVALLTSMRRTTRGRTAVSGQKILQEIRTTRHGR